MFYREIAMNIKLIYSLFICLFLSALTITDKLKVHRSKCVQKWVSDIKIFLYINISLNLNLFNI